ncbi:MAG: glycosyltransferase family 2 protein [Chloroflexota bacterium]
MQPHKVAVLIVAWNQIETTLECLKTVYSQSFEDYEVVLVDNGSDEGFQEEIKKGFPQITCLSSEKNLGFAGGNNIGLKYAIAQGFEYILLLNNDTLLDVNCLKNLVAAKEKLSLSVGGVTAKIYYAQEKTRIWSVGSNFRPWLFEVADNGKDSIDNGQWSVARQVDFAPFCGILFDVSVFEHIGLLDDRYFLYYEDMDYCQRLKAHGKQLYYVPNAIIWHAVSRTSGGNQSPKALYWLARSSGRYFRTHCKGWRLLIIIPYRLLSVSRKTIKFLARKEKEKLSHYWSGLYQGWLGEI